LEAYLHDVALLFSWVEEKEGGTPSRTTQGKGEVIDSAASLVEESIDDKVKQLKLPDLEEFSASLFDLGIAPPSHAQLASTIALNGSPLTKMLMQLFSVKCLFYNTKTSKNNNSFYFLTEVRMVIELPVIHF
jgi:hypothetical protein